MSRGKFNKQRKVERLRRISDARPAPVIAKKYTKPDFEPRIARVAQPDREGTEYYRNAPSVMLTTSTAPTQRIHELDASELELRTSAITANMDDEEKLKYLKREADAIALRDARKTQLAPLYNKGAVQLITSIDQTKDIGRK